ncbi:hypothetical protein ACSBR1_026235 [Camellia fascicularis]
MVIFIEFVFHSWFLEAGNGYHHFSRWWAYFSGWCRFCPTVTVQCRVLDCCVYTAVGIDGRILLVCSYGLVNVLIRLHQDSSFVQIVDDICAKFDGLVPAVVCLVFDVPGYKKFKVDSDDDIQNMLCLAKSFGISHIEVLI